VIARLEECVDYLAPGILIFWVIALIWIAFTIK
jgi:hypothetical protein